MPRTLLPAVVSSILFNNFREYDKIISGNELGVLSKIVHERTSTGGKTCVGHAEESEEEWAKISTTRIWKFLTEVVENPMSQSKLSSFIAGMDGCNREMRKVTWNNWWNVKNSIVEV